MQANFIFFITIILLIYFGINFFLYFSVIKFYGVKNKLTKNILIAIFFWLSINFIILISSMAANNYPLFNLYYKISIFLFGFTFILLSFTILAWIIILICKIFKKDFKLIIGSFIFLFAILYSGVGLWNAENPIIKNVDIKIENLDKNWENKVIVQLSDVHLGRINGADFAYKMVEQVNGLDPDLILITGDLFDGMGSDVDKYLSILNNLKSKKGIYFITGNHEGYLGAETIINKLKDSKITVLDDEMVEIDGLQVIGISFRDFNDIIANDNILKDISGIDGKKTNILLYHVPASLVRLAQSGNEQRTASYWKPNTDFSLVKEAGIDLQLSGHTHSGQFFPFTLVVKSIFNGYSYGLIEEGNFQLYVTSGVGTWGPPIRTGNKSEIVKINLVNR